MSFLDFLSQTFTSRPLVVRVFPVFYIHVFAITFIIFLQNGTHLQSSTTADGSATSPFPPKSPQMFYGETTLPFHASGLLLIRCILILTFP